jgi:hypothetical protein
MQSWESRFKSQALLDERALLSCIAYVDLNPIWAKMAETPEDSAHTSIKARIDALKHHKPLRESIKKCVGSNPEANGLPFLLKDYIKLIDWAGRLIRKDKRGAIKQELLPILERLTLD